MRDHRRPSSSLCHRTQQEAGEEPAITFATTTAAPCSSDVLAEEAVDMLTPEEKDEIILQMHAQLGHMVSFFSSVPRGTCSCVCVFFSWRAFNCNPPHTASMRRKSSFTLATCGSYMRQAAHKITMRAVFDTSRYRIIVQAGSSCSNTTVRMSPSREEYMRLPVRCREELIDLIDLIDALDRWWLQSSPWSQVKETKARTENLR